jgi:nicotinamidase-related amidase
LEQYRKAGGDIVHVTHIAPDGAPVFTPGTPLAAEFDELTPNSGEKTITKHHPSSFSGTDLNDYLKSTGKNKIVLTGYMAHVCVSTTARSGDELGYEVLLVKDAIGDRDIPGLKAHAAIDAVMAEIGDAFGTVITASEVK